MTRRSPEMTASLKGKDFPGPPGERLIEGPIDHDDDEGEAIDPCDVHHLNEREVEVLRMAEVGPGKARQQDRPDVFQGYPEERRKKNTPDSEPDLKEPMEEGKHAQIGAHVGDQQQENEEARDQGNISVVMDGHDDPVDHSEIADDAGQESKDKTVVQPLAFNGIEQRDEGDPRQELEIVFREGEDQKNS